MSAGHQIGPLPRLGSEEAARRLEEWARTRALAPTPIEEGPEPEPIFGLDDDPAYLASLMDAEVALAALADDEGPVEPIEPPPVRVSQAVTPSLSRYVAGGGWVLDAPTTIPAIWGSDDQVLWSEGEPLIIVGPAGVGKSTLLHQLVAGRLGLLGGDLLGHPVKEGTGKLLYLASDRPQQIRRAMRRLFLPEHREALDERLIVWPGPPPEDLARHPDRLVCMCAEVGADTVVLDSLKDMAIGISDDEVGAGLNSAIQRAIADDVQVASAHHQRKGKQDGGQPKSLDDVYGSVWLPNGSGSVVLLWGKAGDPIVELLHLKQPAETVGPLKIEHDHTTGRTALHRGRDLLTALRHAPTGLTTKDAARILTEKPDPNENDVAKARRQLDKFVRTGKAHRKDPVLGGPGGTEPARYISTDRDDDR